MKSQAQHPQGKSIPEPNQRIQYDPKGVRDKTCMSTYCNTKMHSSSFRQPRTKPKPAGPQDRVRTQGLLLRNPELLDTAARKNSGPLPLPNAGT